MDAAIQELVPMTEVKRKNQISATIKTEKQETEPMQLKEKDLTMKMVKVTFAIKSSERSYNICSGKTPSRGSSRDTQIRRVDDSS
jgi:hypothetical protein